MKFEVGSMGFASDGRETRTNGKTIKGVDPTKQEECVCYLAIPQTRIDQEQSYE